MVGRARCNKVLMYGVICGLLALVILIIYLNWFFDPHAAPATPVAFDARPSPSPPPPP
eukprot:CAMPEP_0206171182 /NCGR_PEP_ID=MMETSP1474-20131121/41484_1 /ASSEMBLY_ACC=CAM_ASM_001110 /TAXON_ID=97495 /ORGANISM="Imantonia sp., Strain RCC918" /LENGTH=57 /DNA_ID=CAMNT_0053578415 /DNA_START=18 /DNA_END=188 /DNA_ORIENTATION=+